MTKPFTKQDLIRVLAEIESQPLFPKDRAQMLFPDLEMFLTVEQKLDESLRDTCVGETGDRLRPDDTETDS